MTNFVDGQTLTAKQLNDAFADTASGWNSRAPDAGDLTGAEATPASRGADLSQTTTGRIAALAQAPIAGGTSTDAGALLDTDTVPMGRAGLFQTTWLKVKTYVLTAIANGTSTDASTLTGTETIPVSRGAGLLQTNIATVAQFAQALGPASQSVVDASVNPSSSIYDRIHFLICPTDPSFAADRTGTNDSTAAFNAWFTALAVAGVSAARIPPGTYKYNPANLVMPAGVHVYGAARGKVSFILSGNGDGITVGVDGTLSDVYLSAATALTAGNMVVLGGNGAVLRDFEMDSYFVGVKMYGASNASLIVGAVIKDGLMRTPSPVVGGGAIDVENYASGAISDVIATGSASGAQPGFGLKVRHGDTLILHGLNLTNHGIGLYTPPASSETCFSLEATSCFFDNNHNTSASGSSAMIVPAAGGAVKNMRFKGCWFGFSTSSSGAFVQGQSTGIVDGIEFANCDFVNNGDSGLRADGVNVKNLSVIGGSAAGNATAGVNISGGLSDFSVIGMQIGNISGRGANGQGIVVQTGASDHYTISLNRVRGNTTSQVSDSGTGTNKYVANNPA